MTLEETLQQKLASWRPDTQRQTLTVDHADSGWKLDLQADCVDTVGGRLWEVQLTRTRPAAQPVPLADQARRIANQVTGLLEPLRLIEMDSERDLAQLRSQAPAQRGGDLHYYEVLRHSNGNTQVARYQASHTTSKREQVPFTLTHEALGKLVRDLAD